MQARPYQQRAADAVLEAFGRGLQRVYYVLPTGTGKTFTFVEIASRMGAKVLVLAHRKELLEQAARAFRNVDAAWMPQIEQGELYAGKFARVVAASIPTLVSGKRLTWFQPDLIVADETHHILAESWQQVIRAFGCFTTGGPKLVGCTATPARGDKQLLRKVFQEECFVYTIREAVEAGWLCDVRGFRVRTDTDLSQLATTAGDFRRGALEAVVDVDDRTVPVIRHWGAICPDRPTVVFCAGVRHAEHAALAWRQQGVRAEHVDGSMRARDRDAIITRFKSGHTQVLCNDSILTEGFDYPELSCVVMLRPTQSWPLYVQCVGRGLRIAPGKSDCVVIDAVDNTGRHSLATVPALLGLPPGLDLQGQSLRSAASKIDLVTAQLGAVLEQQQELAFADLDTILEQVNLLTGQLEQPPAALAAGCELVWATVSHGFFVSAGSGRKGLREGRLLRLGADCPICGRSADDAPWSFTLTDGSEVISHGHLSGATDAREALFLSDRALRRKWPDAARVAAADARWRQDKATAKQVDVLERLGYRREIVATLDKGKASQLISQARAG